MKRCSGPIVVALLAALSITGMSQANERPAPGGPGADAHWATAAKNGFGTANTLRSKVWFTLAEGVLTEVYYPTLDLPNVQNLQLIVVTPEGKVETETDNTIHRLHVAGSQQALSFRQENVAKSGAYSIYKSYATDPQHNTLLVQISFQSLTAAPLNCSLYVYFDPSLNNSGLHDSGWTDNNALLANDSNIASALVAAPAFTETTNGYLGSSDGLTDLRKTQQLSHYQRAT